MQHFADDSSTGAQPPQPGPAPNQSENEFLAAQAAAAQGAIADTLRRMSAELKNTADVAAWAKRYPWPTVGVAAAAGFLAAAALGGKSSREKHPADVLAEALAANGISGKPKPSMWSSLVNEVMRNLTGLVEGAITSAFSSKMHQTAQPTTNGHDAAPGYQPPGGHDMPPDGF